MKVISYFSYKGGAGRSTLAYNTIPLLIRNHIQPTKDEPVVVVDMDIDSCGMSLLLGINDADVAEDACVQYVLENGCDMAVAGSISQHGTLKKLIPVGNKFGYPENEAVLFLPAKINKNVSSDGASNYGDSGNPFKQSTDLFVEICENYNVSTIILDSASGSQATANVANEMADVVVCCMRPTIQFVNGTIRYLPKPPVSGLKTFVLVPNVVPQEPMVIDGYKYPDTAITNLGLRLDSVINRRGGSAGFSYNLEMLDDEEFGIPAVKSFMWREGQLATQAVLDENEKVVLQRYEKLAEIIDRV